MRTLLTSVVTLAATLPSLLSQPRVDLRNTYERLICIVPMIGRGTPDDPRRPLFVPPRRGFPNATQGQEIVAFTYQLSDDGRTALVELVARDRAAFNEILKNGRPDVKIFQKGRSKREDIEREFRKHKKNFDLNSFMGVSVP